MEIDAYINSFIDANIIKETERCDTKGKIIFAAKNIVLSIMVFVTRD